MSQEMIGPWRREDCNSFIALNVDLEPEIPANKKLADILLTVGQGRRSREKLFENAAIERAWSDRNNHPIYLWLKRNEHFKKLWRRFEEMRAKSSSPRRLTSASAPFEMLYIVVQFAAWYFAVKDSQNKSIGGRKPNGATAKGRAAAIKHIDALLDHSLMGVSLGWSEQVQLRKLLGQLRSEVVKIDRKPRGGKGSQERGIMERMVMHMLLYFDASSPVIVENFAAMVGWECDTRTAQRYVDAGKELHKELMSKRRPMD